MKYLCLMYCEGKRFEEMSAADLADFQAACKAYDEKTTKSGHQLHAQALESAETAVTVRVREGKASFTDGPFAETKEMLCGFVLIEAKDREEALRIATGEPFAKIGSVEVRPVMDF